ncbi:MAG: retropepsin-like aspartic protease [Candidatus Parabeggiatoa sp.]|nr:retropepsin-like aspartic protease [Candidatus Parabeggiatoa sp.]
MNFQFDGHQGLIIVHAELTGPLGNAVLRLALDTGATITLVNVDILVAIGYDPSSSSNIIEVTTASCVESVSSITLSKILALGHTRTDFPILAHTLPPSSGIDGVLGLDFLRGRSLSLDFSNGKINLV